MACLIYNEVKSRIYYSVAFVKYVDLHCKFKRNICIKIRSKLRLKIYKKQTEGRPKREPTDTHCELNKNKKIDNF